MDAYSVIYKASSVVSPPEDLPPGLDVAASNQHIPFAPHLKFFRYKLRESVGAIRSPIKSLDPTRTIFVRIPKNASTSITTLLYGEGRGVPHFSAEFFRRAYPRRFKSYLSFAALRNPIDRFVSAFTYFKSYSREPNERRLMDETLNFIKDIDDFVLWINDQEDINRIQILKWHHFRKQKDYLCDMQGRIIVDLIFPVEDIETGLNILRASTGITADLPKVNASEIKDVRNLNLDRIRQYYSEDMNLWSWARDKKVVAFTDKGHQAVERALRPGIR